MAVIVYIESDEGIIKKGALEVISYGRAVADDQELSLIGVAFNLKKFDLLNSYGIDKLYNIDTKENHFFNVESYCDTLADIFKKENCRIGVISSSADCRYLGPSLSIKTDASYISNVVALPLQYNPLKLRRSCFTNKAFNQTESLNHKTIISISSNSFGLKEKHRKLEVLTSNFLHSSNGLRVTSVNKITDKVAIADADIVVSGGRGLKGPENWYLIEDLANELGAATACSKPVSDMGWRPHSEHVGQTGKPVASNLYIAIGVSGAIQHLAGINSSKVKVVINNDPEAPFFKAADYGIVGDAFEVVPKLTEKLKARKLN